MTTTDHDTPVAERLTDAAETTLSYCVKRGGKPPWRGPIPWEQPVPEIDAVIDIEGASYHVLDVGVSEPGHGWPNRHISAYVQRQEGHADDE